MAENDLRCRVRRIVQQTKNSLSHTDGDEIKSALLSLTPLLPRWNSDPSLIDITSCDFSKNELVGAREVFVVHEYSGLADCMLGKLSVELTSELIKCQGDVIFEHFFTKGPPIEAFLTLGHSISTTCGFQVMKCVELMESFLRQRGVYHILRDVCFKQAGRSTQDGQLWEEVISLIASLPDRVLSKLKQESSSFFYPIEYIPLVCLDLYKVLTDIHTSIKSGHDCAIAPVCQLLGKLCLLGHGDQVWGKLVGLLLQEVERDPGWCRITEALVLRIPDRCMEATVMSLLNHIPWYGHVRKFLGNAALTNRRLQFLLTNKLLLMRHYPDNRLLWNIIGYLAHDLPTKPLFTQTVQNVLGVWGNASAVKHSSYDQHYYISRAVLIALAFLKINPSWSGDLKQDLLLKLLSGMPAHLDSSVIKIRRLGMVVGECLTSVLETTGHKLVFEYEMDSETEELKSLLNIPPDPGQDPILRSLDNVTIEEKVEGVDSTRDASNSPPVASDDLDSDDELQPYDMSADTKVSSVKTPLYLRECMEGLINYEDPDRVEVSLVSAEKIIRKNSNIVAEVAEEFTKILLHLDNAVAIKGFTELRHEAMVALTVSASTQVTQYLTKEVYARNYNLRQRMDILEVLAAAAKELSKPPSRDKNMLVPPEQSYDHDPGNWRAVVQRRIEMKTRRFAQGEKQSEFPSCENRFADVASLFFFPLLANFDKTDVSVDLLGDDHIVLTRLLYTLGVIVYAAVHAPIVRQMAKALLEFLWLFRYHHQSGVRQAVHYCVCMVLLAIPHHMLVTEFHADIYDLKTWLQDCAEKDTDGDCRQFSVQALVLMENSLKKEFSQENAS